MGANSLGSKQYAIITKIAAMIDSISKNQSAKLLGLLGNSSHTLESVL